MLKIVGQNRSTAAPVSFEEFWLIYPKKMSRKDAHKAWMKLHPDDQFDATVALVDWSKVWEERSAEEPDKPHRFTPLAATWLNGERWTDEVPQVKKAKLAASHKPFTAKPGVDVAPRSELPQHVKDAIAALRR